MPFVLTTGSTVLCGPLPAHGGGIVAITSTAKLKVLDQPVLLETSIVGQAFKKPCQVQEPGKKCSTLMSVVTTFSSKLKVNSSPVILEPLTGTTDGTGTLDAQANQIKLTAI